MKKYKFFWGGPFSNWYPSKFKVNGIQFSCGEQYMMYQKAIGFGDIEMAQEILKATTPKEQKELGRKVKNFDPKVWNDIKYDLVKTGLRAKFTQNEDLKDELLKYKGWLFVEASPEDRIWGIGYHVKDALANKQNWGENLLGKILTELTEEIV